MTPPAWATALAAAVCADAGVVPPRLSWRRRSQPSSTGLARRAAGIVAVRAGSDPLDQRLTLLHELAHWLAPAPAHRRGRRAVHHGRAFYDVAFALYERHGIAAADALRLESGRYRSSLRHAAALGVPGATEALAAHRSSLRARPRRRWGVLVPEHRIEVRRDGRWWSCVTCGQRVVGRNLSRVRGSRRGVRHTLLGVVAQD